MLSYEHNKTLTISDIKMASTDTLSTADKAKLRHGVEEGIKTLQAIDDLRESLKDTLKAIAEELDIKPSVLTKAIKVAYKDSFEDEKEQVDELETILHLVGRR